VLGDVVAEDFEGAGDLRRGGRLYFFQKAHFIPRSFACGANYATNVPAGKRNKKGIAFVT
jgi:hypothetical protein